MNDHPRDLFVDPKVLGAIRRAEPTETDLKFFADLIRFKYGDRFKDPAKLEANLRWLAPLFERRDHTCLRGRYTAGVARITQRYGCEHKAQLVGLAAWPGAGWEPLRMIRVMVLWAKAMGATGALTLDADTGLDFEPFARRLGGKAITMVKYEIPLE